MPRPTDPPATPRGRERSHARRLLTATIIGCVLPLAAAVPVRAAFSVTTATSASMASDTMASPTGLSSTTDCYPAGRPAPAFRSTSSSSSGGPTVTVTAPATQVGDVLIAMAIGMSNPGEIDFTATGWTRLRQVSNGNSYDLMGAVFWRRATAAEPASHAFQMGDPDPGAVVIVAYSGVDTVTAVEAHGGQFFTNSTSSIAPSITTTSTPTRLVTGFAVGGLNTVAAPTGEVQRRLQTVSGGVIGVSDESFATAGATGTRSVALGSNRDSVGMVLALRGLPQPTVTLTWTPTTDTYATGYQLTRTGGGGPMSTTVSGRTTATASDTTPTAGTAYTYSLSSAYGNWRSTAATRAVTAC